MDTCGFIFVLALELFQSFGCADVSDSTARHDTFLDCRTGCIEGILHTVFLFLHLDFGCCTHVEHSHTAGELAETLLKLLAVVV